LQGDYTQLPSYFKADATGTIAVHYGRSANILNYDGSDSSKIVINYSVQIGVNGESIPDALNYIQTPLAHWKDPIADGGGFPVPWENPTITYTVTSSENTGVGYTFSMPAATTGNDNSGNPTTATPTPTSTDVVYVSTSATVSVNANYSQVNIDDFRTAAQNNLVSFYSVIPYSNLTITDIRSGSIITDYVITYPQQYQSQVEALAASLTSGTFAGYQVISADSTGTVRDQSESSTTIMTSPMSLRQSSHVMMTSLYLTL